MSDHQTTGAQPEPTEAEVNAAKQRVTAAFDTLADAPENVRNDPYTLSVYLAGISAAFKVTGDNLASMIALRAAEKTAALLSVARDQANHN